MDWAELRREIIQLTDTCREQATFYEKVTTRYSQSMGTDRAQDWRGVYVEWSRAIADTVEGIRGLAQDAPKDSAAKLLEAASHFGHGPESNARAISLLSEAAALIDGQQGADTHRTPDKPKGATVNARIFDTLTKDPNSRNWTAYQWAQHLNCSEGTVKGTATWKGLMTERAGLKMTRNDRPKRR